MQNVVVLHYVSVIKGERGAKVKRPFNASLGSAWPCFSKVTALVDKCHGTGVLALYGT